ncbi:rRNA cytosine-C5-methyltransferase [Paenibacillus sp. CAA11]|uniref:RsmB/NOP family class I SAM-dependent RNA methyltransferase n=1 Tax=Paenibacillus sp. CAA11 TaxID=1532905 RepID=UPI000D381D9E|nr:RsmB/NOP family class I SAM-dependent RNA methyltransferase [Paenibacillus sp. CAA11]AWB44175.1 rRNA cytosine-C5-methyltransferase [Paenibacillus sp. CAA11]
MAVSLPPLFLDRMQRLLKDEYNAFLASYEKPRFAGIRVNTLKISRDAFFTLSPFSLRPVPWCETGFYIDEGLKPGKHPYYHAGLYYIQEPSAMAPAEALDVQPGDRVLDLCAAPGGKSTQIAARLQGEGLLVTNDISAERTKALAKNIELYGVRNAIVLNETPERIAKAFPHFFNKILIDAPCSGEGMFRKDEDMARQWEKHSVEKCSLMQRDILQSAARLLSPGGTIVYSTCTFAPEEDEGQIASFLKQHEDFEVIPLPEAWGIASGRPEWLQPSDLDTEWTQADQEALARTADTGRLWPHRIEGEGHFVAVLRHTGEAHEATTDKAVNESVKPGAVRRKEQAAARGRGGKRDSRQAPSQDELLRAWKHFCDNHLAGQPEHAGHPVWFGSQLYLAPLEAERLSGLKTVRPGWYVGSVKNGRFVPAQPLAAALRPEEAGRVLKLSSEEGEAVRYLKGETLQVPQERLQCQAGMEAKGYILVCVDGYSLGWGKWQDGMLKNEYPPGWRWQ